MDIVDCIVCDAVKSSRTFATEDYRLMSGTGGEMGWLTEKRLKKDWICA